MASRTSVPPSRFSLGNGMLTFVGLVTMIAPYIADWNETHVLNPKWPPHARFHNGQTMSTGFCLGLSTIYFQYFAYHSPSVGTASSSSSTASSKRTGVSAALMSTHLNLALLFQHLYYVPAMSGILYPGARFSDPEFGEGAPQAYVFTLILAIAWAGWWLERARIQGLVQERKVE